MDLVEIGALPADATYVMPWRAKGTRAGKVKYQGTMSTTVHQPRLEGDGWETIAIAKSTQVIPTGGTEYFGQGFGQDGAGGRMVNRSTIKKPVDIVHDLCDEIIGRENAWEATTAKRNEMINAAVGQGVNINTAKTQFYHWRKKYR